MTAAPANALSQHFTPATSADPVTRLADLIAAHRATLDLAASYADRAPGDQFLRTNITKYRARLDHYERRATGMFAAVAAEHALGMLGRNGCGPAIADLLRSARFHAGAVS